MMKHTLVKKRSSELRQGSGDCKPFLSQEDKCSCKNEDYPGSKQVQPSLMNGFVDSSGQHTCLEEERDKSDYLAAQEEWENVQNITPGNGDIIQKSPLISFNETLQYFQTSDLGNYLKAIKPTVRHRGLSALTHFLFGPPKLHRDLVDERNLVFAIGLYSFEDGQSVHLRVLQTIYKRLLGSKYDCPRYGHHWEIIGFQGTDPSTDLRGTGFLGLMHALYLVMDPQTLPLAREIYKLSQHEIQNFPFCLMSINITRVAVQALREEVLNRECNRRKQVIAVMNDFYAGTLLYLFQIWKQQHKTIADSGYVLKEVEAHTKKNPRAIIRNLEIYLKDKRSSQLIDSPSMSKGREDKALSFTGICEWETS